MKERIENLLNQYKSRVYDTEIAHGMYDEILQDFVLNYDESLLPIIKELIEVEKDLWYA